MSQFDNIIFKNKKFSDVLEEIYNNQKKKDQQVTALISELKPLISDFGDTTLVVPLIKEYMEISVKNDDILIDHVLSLQYKITKLIYKILQNDASVQLSKSSTKKKNYSPSK